MKLRLLTIAVAAGLGAKLQAAQSGCEHVEMPAQVELAAPDLLLSDLLPLGVCLPGQFAAKRMLLGKAPLPGSPRVFEGDQVRVLLGKLEHETGVQTASWSVPQRITVRRRGDRASCISLASRIFAGMSNIPQPVPENEMECAAAGRIPENAPLEAIKATWNDGRKALDISARCVHSADCVPFLVRIRDEGFREVSLTGPGFSSIEESHAVTPVPGVTPPSGILEKRPVVRPGQSVSLLWDADGIRVRIGAVCLDRGGTGELVRARIARSGTIVRAIVVDGNLLRAGSRG